MGGRSPRTLGQRPSALEGCAQEDRQHFVCDGRGVALTVERPDDHAGTHERGVAEEDLGRPVPLHADEQPFVVDVGFGIHPGHVGDRSDPALDLTLSGEYEWFGGWGVTISDGRAQGATSASAKLHDRIRLTGEYSIEAWVVPANVTQEMSRIVTYSAGDTARNFSLNQTLYNYDFLHRSTTTGANGDQPQLSTPDADEVLFKPYPRKSLHPFL